MPVTLREALSFGRTELSASASPDVDVQVLLCHVMQCQPSFLHIEPDYQLTEGQWQQFAELIARRKHGHPVAYLTGMRGFWSLDLEVNEATLIPRPDTELLVSLALGKLGPGMKMVDLGTGSGAIALALAAEKPDISIIATDYSMSALATAKQNAKQHQIDNVEFVQMSWLRGFNDASFDLVVSNPPYIRAQDPHLRQGDVRFEPMSALISGADGLDDLRQIIAQSQRCLKTNGWLLVEHGYDQAEAVQQLLVQAGFDHVSSHQDFGGQDRAVMGQLTL